MRLLVGMTLCLLLVAGCGPAVPPEELGTVLDKVPEVPGAEQPYEMPELGPPPIDEPEPVESASEGQ